MVSPFQTLLFILYFFSIKHFHLQKHNTDEYDVRKYFHVSMVQDPWAECTKKNEFVFANMPTDDDFASDVVDGNPDACIDSSRSPDTTGAANASDDDIE